MHLWCFVIVGLVASVQTAPAKQPIKSENVIEENVVEIEKDKHVDSGVDENDLEYSRYLRQVMDALDSDKEFQKKVENITHDQIINGHVARQIEVIAPEVRSRLDEFKRMEIERLRKLTMKEHQLELSMQENNDPSKAHHIDHSNPHTFEAEDLQKLILKATADLQELDTKRRRDFKQYEMEKEIQYRDSLQNMTAEQRTEMEKKHEETKKKHQEHAKVHHPGSKQQLEQVWEEQDQMPRQEFDPKVFFQLHDVNGDGYLDQEEVESLLSIEVRKLYNEKDPSYDKNEMLEEYHRMREDMYREFDANKDGLISKKEFVDYANRPEFTKDDGWKGIEEAPVYSEEELKQYEQQRHQEALARHYEQYGTYYVPHPAEPVYQQHPGGYQQPVYYQAHPGQPPQLQPQQQVQYVVNAPAQHVQIPTQYHHVELPPGQHPQQQQYQQQGYHPNQQQQYHPNQQQQPYNPNQQQAYHQAQQNYHAVPPAQVHPGQYQPGPAPGQQPVNYGLPQNQAQQHSPPPQQFQVQQQHGQQHPPPPPAQHH